MNSFFFLFVNVILSAAVGVGASFVTNGPYYPAASNVYTVVRTNKFGFIRSSVSSISGSSNNNNNNNNNNNSRKTEKIITKDHHSQEEPRQQLDTEGISIPVTIFERARILFYRTLLGCSALLISERGIGTSGVLDGTGFRIEDAVLLEQTQALLPLVAGLSLVVAPVPQTASIRIAAFGLGIASVVAGGDSALLFFSSLSDSGDFNAINSIIVGNSLSWTLSILALMAVSIREILYFGGVYKRECGITLFALPLMLDVNTQIPLTTELCALGLSVLAAGKIFEPIKEDLEQTNSEFLAK